MGFNSVFKGIITKIILRCKVSETLKKKFYHPVTDATGQHDRRAQTSPSDRLSNKTQSMPLFVTAGA